MESMLVQTDASRRHPLGAAPVSRSARRWLARVFLRWAALFLTSPAALQIACASVLYVDTASTSPLPPYSTWATAAQTIQDAVDAAVAGDEILVTNGLYASGGRVIYGALTNRVAVNKPVFVHSVNGVGVTVIEGYQLPASTNGDGAVRCVYLTNGASLAGFTLTNGATRIQGTSPQERAGGAVYAENTTATVSNCVLVANSANTWGGAAYAGTLLNCTLSGNSAMSGGGAAYATLTNCALCRNSLGPYGANANGGGAYQSTLADCTLTGNSGGEGGGASRSTLTRCALTNNSAVDVGGGVSICTLSQCTLSGNAASWGGGADHSDLFNCMLVANSAYVGGGVAYSTLRNCTVANNNCTSSNGGGGAAASRLFNSILFANTSANLPNNYLASTLNYCCTTPLPPNGFGNITNNPRFLDPAAGDFRLQSNSPCINAGNHAYVTTITDLDGNPRIVGRAVDLGAYECQSPGSVIPYAWLRQYGLPTDGSADYTDPDGDGLNNWQEWICGTNPTNATSTLRMVGALPATNGVSISWQSVAGVNYFLERSANLSVNPGFMLVATNVPGQSGTTTFTDPGAATNATLFYRVGVASP